MRRAILIVIFAVFSIYCQAQTATISGYCTLGGVKAAVSGLYSTNYTQGIIPSCTVTVYLTGTQTLATIYSDGNNTPLSNPFTANAITSSNPGSWQLFAAVNQGYDVVLSGGISPNVYPSPVTLTGLYPAQRVVNPSVSYLPLSGGTLTGPLVLPATTPTGNQAVSAAQLNSGNLPVSATTIAAGTACPTGTPVGTVCKLADQSNGYTVSTLPSSPVVGMRVTVTDANPTCATGGGAGKVDCRWNGSSWDTIGGSGGINQLTGDVLAGPGSGSQAATLPTVNSSPGTCGDATHVCQETTNGKGLVTNQTPVAINTLSYPSPTLNYIPKVFNTTSPGQLGNSSILDSGTGLSTTETWQAAGYVSTAAGCNAAAPLLAYNGGCATNSGSGAILLSTYGAVSGTHVGDASTTNTSATITCPNSDCNFVNAVYPAGDIGKVVFVTNATTDVSEISSTVIVPASCSGADNTITAVNSAQSITVACAATATVTGNARLVWGPLSTAPYNVTPTTGNDPLFAACQAAASQCLPLQIPVGLFLADHGECNTYPTTARCFNTNLQIADRTGFQIQGYGETQSVIVPTPNVPATDCTGPNGAGNGCFFSMPTPWYQNFTIDGEGNSALGATFNGKIGMQIPDVSVGTNVNFTHMHFEGWGTATTGFTGIQIGQGTGISNIWFNNVGVESFGNVSLYLNPLPGNQSITFIDQSYAVVCGDHCLDLENGIIFSANNEWGWAAGTSAAGVVYLGTAGTAPTFRSTNDFWYSASGNTQNLLQCGGSGSQVTLVNDYLSTSQVYSTSTSAIRCSTNLKLSGTTVISSGTNGKTIGGSGIYDLGGNTITGTWGSISAGSFYGDASVTGVAAAVGNFSMGAQWGTSGNGAAISAVTGGIREVQFTAKAATTGTTSSPTLTYTFPTTGSMTWPIAPQCMVRQIGGSNFTDLTNPTWTVTTTSVVVTLSGTPTASDTYIFDITCHIA